MEKTLLSNPLPVAAEPVPYLARLNDAQRQAVEAMDGPVLVLAGAGTGKTRVLTTRMAHILLTGRAHGGEILAVTFTNKAAGEMRERLGTLLGKVSDGWWVGTFHHISARMLRRHAELVGLKPNFTILDADDQIRLIRQIMLAENIDEKKSPARLVANLFSRWKDRGLSPEKVQKSDTQNSAEGKEIALYYLYQERLISLNACDFGDLLLHMLTILMNHSFILEEWQRRFKYILVDEYQDSNVCQYLWLRLLTQARKNLCVVGDDDQSIYGWRGAEVSNILRFETDYPGTVTVRLEQNYRSTGYILAAASALIAHNNNRLGKTLWTAETMGEPVTVMALWDDDSEAREVGAQIEILQQAKQPLGEIAILVRAGYLTRRFEERFIQIAIPYRVLGGVRFYDRQEVRDAIAYLRIVHTSSDDLAFERILNKPKRGLATASLAALSALRRAESISLYMAAERLVETQILKPAARRSLVGLLHDFARWRTLAADLEPSALAEIILDESGYTGFWQAEYQKTHSPEAAGRLENLKELVTALADFPTLEGFLDHISLVGDLNNVTDQGETVNLMTLHAAKGLEFTVVFLPGWEESVFPNQRALDESGLQGLEEERRLAYVGLTRARQRVFISHCANRRRPDQRWEMSTPSRFIGELPESTLQYHSDGRQQITTNRDQKWDYPTQSDVSISYAPRFEENIRMPIIENQSRRMSASQYSSKTNLVTAAGLSIGSHVFHRKFGYGIITATDGDKMSIDFDKAGTKRVMARFIIAADQAD